jgi:hypothetical protein
MYSNSKPQLVSHKTLKQLGKTFKVTNVEQIQWTESVGSFYEDYIQPNLFAIIVFMMLVLFLTIRYALKVDEKKKKSRIRKLSKKIRYKTNHDDIDIDFPDNFSYHNNSVYDGSIYPEYMLRDELIDNGNGNMLYKLQKEYEYNVENNDGSMSDQMMKDMYQTRTSKYLFDEMSRVISGK